MRSPQLDGSESSRPRSFERLASRVGASLASPLGILLIMPGLVSLVGTFLTLVGEHALSGSNLEVAQERMLEQARLVATSVRDALEQAEPMLDQLEDRTLRHDPARPFEPFAHALLDLMRGRPGVTYVSASFPDGTFQGAYLDDDGVIRFQDSRVRQGGTRVRRFDYGARDTLRLAREEVTGYDPRLRGFYDKAVRAAERVWSKPYLFYASHVTGITRASPVYTLRDGLPTLHAVVTIDFDVHALSQYLRGRRLSGMRALLYDARDGTLLAYASDPAAALTLAPREERPLRLPDLDDPLLGRFFAETEHAKLDEARSLSLSLDGTRFLGAIAPVSRDPTLVWSLAYLVPEQQFLQKLHDYEDESLAIAAFAVLLSTLLAYLFARHITRVREEAAHARAEARAARALAREARAEARELGSYRLVACLGRGGMGEVWRAQHRLLAREAAIKLIKHEEAGEVSEAMRTRFRREAEALAHLRSRNTIELFDYGVAEDGTFFFVMELLDGLDLDTLVTRHGPQPVERVIHLLVQVCSSLAEAHSAGLVHRDIKPANLFVCRAGDEVDVVKVLDFGLVRAVLDPREELSAPLREGLVPSGLTHAEGMVGTPGYMAPEQARGHAIDGRADLYALGGVAYWLLTGHLVFGASQNPIDQLVAHVHEPVPDLRARLPADVPDALVQLIEACLAKRPEERPPDARTLRTSLRAIVLAPERVWSEERAQAWWRAHRPHATEPPPDEPAPELTVGATVTVTRE